MPVSLLHPGLFAIGLACVSIPIILHLLKRRRRVVSWGAMRFLEEAYRKRRRIITIEQFILLTLRCLLIALIALGVGSLMLGSGNRSSEPTTLVIVLDDSIGSALEIDGVSALDASKRHATDAIESLDPSRGDRVALLSASGPARAIVLPPSDDFGAVLALLDATGPSDSGLDIAGVSRVLTDLGEDPDRPTRRVLLFASDARTMEQAAGAIEASPTRAIFDELRLVAPAQGRVINVGIAGTKATRSLIVRDGLTLPEAVRVELLRSGDDLPEQTSTIAILDDQQNRRGEAQVSWTPGQRNAVQSVAIDTQGLSIQAGTSSILRVRIDNDANPRDNTGTITLPVRGTLRVGVVDRPDPRSLGGSSSIAPARWARAALSPSSDMGVQVTSIDAQQAASRLVPNLDALVILAPAALSAEAWERVARLREQGVMLLITPDAQNESLAWFERVREMAPETFAAGERTVTHAPAAQITDQIEPASLLSGISGELPALAGAVEIYRSLQIPRGAIPVATLSDGSPLASQITPRDGTGTIVLLALPMDLNWSNLPARPLFVAMMQELVRQGVGLGATAQPIIAGSPLPQPLWVQSTRRIPMPGDTLGEDQSHDLNQITGVLAQRDAQGSVRSLLVIQPDSAAGVADSTDQQTLLAQLDRLVDAGQTVWVGEGATESADTVSTMVSSTDARSLALWMLWAAAGIAALEFILARLFTSRLIASERAMGAASSGGARA